MYKFKALFLVFCSTAFTANAYEPPFLHAGYICNEPYTEVGINSYEPITQIAVSSGWRSDRVSTFVVAKVPVDDHFEPFTNDRIKGKSINIWEIGFNGNFGFPQILNECSWWWLNNFYVNGYAYWGRVFDGKYSAVDEDLTVDPPVIDFTHSGDIKSGKSENYQIELGWLYTFCWSDFHFGIAPIVGYSWDQLQFVATHVEQDPPGEECLSCDFDFPTIRQGLKYTTKWTGPFVGFNLVYDLCFWNFNFGYEYHWAQWRASYTLRFPDDAIELCSGFSDKRKADDGHGNVVYLNAAWHICDCWALGFGGKYRTFEVENGTLHPAHGTFEVLSCDSDRRDKVKKAKWESWEVTADIAYRF